MQENISLERLYQKKVYHYLGLSKALNALEEIPFEIALVEKLGVLNIS